MKINGLQKYTKEGRVFVESVIESGGGGEKILFSSQCQRVMANI